MKKRILLILLLIQNLQVFPQWENLGLGFNRQGRILYYDPSTNLLYAGGNFEYADSVFVNCIAVWNGIKWDSLGKGPAYGGPVYSITKYQNKIYASGKFYYHQFEDDNWLGSWNGQNWDTSYQRVNSVIDVFKEFNNDLYFGGSFTKIGNQNASLIAKFDGNNFTPFPLNSEGGGFFVKAIEFFQGHMYVGGNFYDTINGVNDLERWDGISFQPFGGNGLAFGSDYVSSMVVYNNELYIAGGFWLSSGSPANNIMRWDGNQFYDVGGGLNGGALKMHIFNGELYICGAFTMAGTVPVNYIAKWNGVQWSEVCSSTFNNGPIQDFTIINNDLYVIGGFTLIDTIPIKYIAKYAGYTDVTEYTHVTQINISPNPANNKLIIRNKKPENISYEIYDVLGKKYFVGEIDLSVYEISIYSLEPGLYFLVLKTDVGRIVKKFIKE